MSLSESSLCRILKELKPSQRKSLAGLDSTTADGLNGFSILADIVKKYFPGNKGIVDNTWKGENNILKLDTQGETMQFWKSQFFLWPMQQFILNDKSYQFSQGKSAKKQGCSTLWHI